MPERIESYLTDAIYRNIMILLLCLTAGIVDVIGYLSLDHVFTANMTGNIILLGLAIGNSFQTAILNSLTALTGFIIGVILASAIVTNKEKTFWPPAVTTVLAVEGAVLLLFALLSYFAVSASFPYLLIILLSIAMGLQTTAARRLGIAGISTTVLTGTLATFFEDFTARFFGGGKKKGFTTDALLRAAALVLYCSGAVIAALAEPSYQFAIIWLPIAIIIGIIILAVTRFHNDLEKD
ncbi:YoaK family protein [Bacillus atrophaeus]|uniref:YoaK family protein n=1 Tax=Bacillus atrophaeus TaxID=1452 RepID=UPI002E2266D5|nr:YoaK family protein [Bacillus atrophaeus]MED1029112.1 YoaK family protein [Bacillus atrophaeus]MED1117179.1 YoaK family protein [Bacillus atrophaeus]MED1133392.1 YoaK family protein [Bacillus atrophaeus]